MGFLDFFRKKQTTTTTVLAPVKREPIRSVDIGTKETARVGGRTFIGESVISPTTPRAKIIEQITAPVEVRKVTKPALTPAEIRVRAKIPGTQLRKETLVREKLLPRTLPGRRFVDIGEKVPIFQRVPEKVISLEESGLNKTQVEKIFRILQTKNKVFRNGKVHELDQTGGLTTRNEIPFEKLFDIGGEKALAASQKVIDSVPLLKKLDEATIDTFGIPKKDAEALLSDLLKFAFFAPAISTAVASKQELISKQLSKGKFDKLTKALGQVEKKVAGKKTLKSQLKVIKKFETKFKITSPKAKENFRKVVLKGLEEKGILKVPKFTIDSKGRVIARAFPKPKGIIARVIKPKVTVRPTLRIPGRIPQQIPTERLGFAVRLFEELRKKRAKGINDARKQIQKEKDELRKLQSEKLNKQTNQQEINAQIETQKIKVGQATRELQIVATASTQAIKILQVQRQQQKLAAPQRTATQQRIAQRQITQQRFRPPTFKTPQILKQVSKFGTPTKPPKLKPKQKPPKIPLLIPLLDGKPKKKKVVSLIKVKGKVTPFIKQKPSRENKFKKLGKPTTLPKAKIKLFKELNTTLRASGFLQDARGKRIKPRSLPREFRFSKNKRTPNLIVERRKFRLDSPQERASLKKAKSNLKSTKMIKVKKKK